MLRSARASRPIAMPWLYAMLALSWGPACSDDASGTRGPKRTLPSAGEPAASPEPAAQARSAADDRTDGSPAKPRAGGMNDVVACPPGTEPRGAAPPTALESYCLRPTDEGALRHGPYRQWYPDGTVRADGTFADDERHGLWTEYRADGTKMAETTFERGTRDGRWRTWHDNGQRSGEGAYRDGKKYGVATFWFEDGTKQAEGEWQRDLKVGVSTNWRPDGSLESRGEYVAGNKQGDWLDVDERGNEIESKWNDGVRVLP